MRWDDINDPTGEYEFVGAWNFIRTDDMYKPHLVQEIINKSGVEAMVNIVNQQFKMRRNIDRVLNIVEQDGKKIVVQA